MTWLVSLFSQFFRWLAARGEYKSTPQGQDDAARAKSTSDAKALDAKVAKAQRAVHGGEEDEVNRTLKELGFLLVISVLMTGCVSRPIVYVLPEERAVRMEKDGKPGWWLPDAVMGDLLSKAIRNKAEVKP
jgi:hypothetical protein